jgi:hypothetical protein
MEMSTSQPSRKRKQAADETKGAEGRVSCARHDHDDVHSQNRKLESPGSEMGPSAGLWISVSPFKHFFTHASWATLVHAISDAFVC